MSHRMSIRRFTLLSASISAAVAATATTPETGLPGAKYVGLEARFDYAASGTSVYGYVQTSFDSGANWTDIAALVFSAASGRKAASLDGTAVTTVYTPTSGTLADNTVKNGLLGDRFRVVYKSTGDHGGKDFVIVGVAKG